LNFIFDNDRPIYIQLMEYLKLGIINGKFPKGEKMPSVRDLALETKVNPNTMQKALSELEETGLVYSKKTSGRYVTEDEKVIKSLKDNIANKKVDKYLEEMNKLGYCNKEAIKYLEKKGKIK